MERRWVRRTRGWTQPDLRRVCFEVVAALQFSKREKAGRRESGTPLFAEQRLLGPLTGNLRCPRVSGAACDGFLPRGALGAPLG